MKKYELDKNDSIEKCGCTLYRVIYTDEFIEIFNSRDGIKIDKKGGYIESEKNLSQFDYAVVIDDAKVFGDARVMNHAVVAGNVVVSDAIINNYAFIVGMIPGVNV